MSLNEEERNIAREEDISPMIGYTKVLIEKVERIINS